MFEKLFRRIALVVVLTMVLSILSLVPTYSASTLISLNKPVIALSYETGHGPNLANDSDKSNNSYWSAPIGAYGDSWWQIDLQGTYNLTSINIRNWVDGTRYYKYYIRTSMDGIHWTPLAAKNNNNVATDAGDTYNVCTVGRYLRVNLTYNSANPSVHISDFKVYGYPVTMPSANSVSVISFETNKNSYNAGETVYLNYNIKNNTTSSKTISKVRIRKHGLTYPLVYDENVIASNITLGAGQSYTGNNTVIWYIPSNTQLGAYGFWLSVELSNGEVYDTYQSFTRIVNSSTLLSYNIGTQNYNGLKVFTLDGGMSAETAVEKAMENLESSTSHSWYVSPGGGPNSVYSSLNFMQASMQKTVDYYNNNFGSTTTFDTVIIAPGNCLMPYLSKTTKAPILPVQFLVSANTYKELRAIVDYSNANGVPCYSTLGHDGSVPDLGVAWVKLLDLPQVYKNFIAQHNVKNVIFAATTASTGGESTAKKVIEPGTVLSGTNPGDIYILYPFGGGQFDIDQLSQRIKDVNEIQLETNYRSLNDWESGMLPSQVDTMAQSAKNTIGAGAQAISITGDSSNLYDFATYVMCAFFKKNESYLSQFGPVIKGVTMNPYLIAHPAYETKIGYIPALFWQQRTAADIVDNTVNTMTRNAIAAYFPSINFNSLNFWVNYTNNFGGSSGALAVRDRLIYKGLTNITTNDYTKNEVWNTADGMTSPVEKAAVNIMTYSSPAAMKTFDSNLASLNIQDIIDIQAKYPNVTIATE